MMMFREIFIEPEIKRINMLNEKEKDFADLVNNVVEEQYDKMLGVEFKETRKKYQDKNKSNKDPQKNNHKKRPFSSYSKTTHALFE